MNDAADPGALWQRHMRRGDWAAAWALSDAAVAARGGAPEWHKPRHLQAVWDGSPVAGRRVLVRCYHGLGDTIQFARYLPPLAAIAREVTVWAQPSLIPLLRTMRGGWRWLPLHDGTPACEYDVDLEIMELAHLFRSTPATVPAAVPYLHPPRAPRTGGVGLVWQAGEWDPRRSVPPELFLGWPGIEWRLLQRGPALAAAPRGLGTPAGDDDPLCAAAAMAALDLVVTVDSMPAHLAGALGVPVFALLHAEADWRWMEGRDDTPWYPTMRLFRQPRPGDWRSVVAAVRDAVAAAPPPRRPSPA